uniref:Endothelin converting enzyme 2a n=1 Tax=Astyanax mexicanus TaxID=7994 RepID=A0A8B9J847_ASTMX
MIDMEYLPHSNAEYKDMQYWNTRYQTEESFEWFGDFSRFQHLLVQHVGRYDSILMLGCGNSALSTDMCQAGYTSITNVDYSSVCVETMAQRHSDCAGLSWVCMDIRRLAFPDASFDVVIEKGTLDAMLVDERDPWNVSDSSAHLLHQVLSEVNEQSHDIKLCYNMMLQAPCFTIYMQCGTTVFYNGKKSAIYPPRESTANCALLGLRFKIHY